MAAASLLLQTGEEDEQHRAGLPPLPHSDCGTLCHHLVHLLGEAVGETANLSIADIVTSSLNIAGSESTYHVATRQSLVFPGRAAKQKKAGEEEEGELQTGRGAQVHQPGQD